jgi:flagellar hook-associated protein 2
MGISSAGIGSGLDVNSIVSQLMAVERQPLQLMQQQASVFQTQLSVFGSLQSHMTTIGDAARKLADATLWTQTSPSSSDPSSVAVTSTTAAKPGTLLVGVSQLAQAQSASSGVYSASSAAVGTGTLHIDLGTWSDGYAGFTTKSGSTGIDITIGDSDNTLAGIRDKINAANAGVTATVLNDASGSRLVLNSSTTGADNGFRITVADASDGSNIDAAGLSGLAFDPPSGTTTTAVQKGLNLQGTINGAAVTSATNTLTNVVDGATLTASKVTTSPVTVTIGADTTSMKAAITAFVTAFNDTSKYLHDETSYNADTKTSAPLQGDSLAVGLLNKLRSTLGGSSGASAAFHTLSDIGLELQRDGTIKVNDTKLSAALSGNLAEVGKLFSHVDTVNAANNGFGKLFSALSDNSVGTDGMITGRTNGLNSRIKHNQTDQDNFNTRMDGVEARMRAQYTALDTQMAQLNGLSSYVSQQVALLNKSSSS